MDNEKYAYCKKCRKQIDKPKRKKLDSFQLQILVIASFASFGLAALAFIIYRLIAHKKKYCPNCGEEVKFYESPEDFPKKIPVINLPISSKKDENEESKKTEFVNCIECEEEIEKTAEICPFCGAVQNVNEDSDQ